MNIDKENIIDISGLRKSLLIHPKERISTTAPQNVEFKNEHVR